MGTRTRRNDVLKEIVLRLFLAAWGLYLLFSLAFVAFNCDTRMYVGGSGSGGQASGSSYWLCVAEGEFSNMSPTGAGWLGVAMASVFFLGAAWPVLRWAYGRLRTARPPEAPENARPTAGDHSAMNSPILRAVTESGSAWDDPSEDLLFELLSDLERGDELFFVVERLGVAEVYMQVLFQDDRQYLVEHRAGGPASHFAATCADKRIVHETLTKWALEIPGWQELHAWAPVTI